MTLSSALAELRRRNVIKVAVGYAVVAYLVSEVADIFLPALTLPSWTVTLVVALLVLGFPVAVVLAWTLQVTTEGIVRDHGGETPGTAPPNGADTAVAAAYEHVEVDAHRAEPDPSIAVLAFMDMSPEGDQEYLGDGVSEEIIDALTKLPTLRVAARTSCFAFKGRDEDVRAIGRKLGVGAVLEGSVRKAGTRLRITAQLISVQDGYHLWSEKYDRELDDVFEVQDDIARAVVEALRVELLGEQEHLVRSTTHNAEAYDQYLKGRKAWRQRYQLGLDAALGHFRKAVELDPDFAEAHAGICDTYSVIGLFAFDRSSELRAQATESVEHALAAGADAPDVQFAAGLYQYVFGWDLPQGIWHLREAIRLGGRHPRARVWLGNALGAQGHTDEWYTDSRGAFEEAPDSAYIMAVHCLACACTGRHDEARSLLSRVLALEPTDLIVRYGVGMMETLLDRHDAALDLLTYVHEHGGSGAYTTMLAGALARAGRRAEADDLMADVQKRYGNVSVGWALFHSMAGDVDEAYAAISQAVKRREPGGLLAVAMWCTLFAPLRDDPRWAMMVPFLKGE